jgi:hypothetical protein
MNKLLIGIVIGLFSGLFACYTLTLFFTHEIISKDYARVTIRNHSGRNVKEILLQHERGTIEASDLKDKDEVRFIFKNMNENSYYVRATFDDGSTLNSESTYIEHGYRGMETIKESEIVIENNW